MTRSRANRKVVLLARLGIIRTSSRVPIRPENIVTMRMIWPQCDRVGVRAVVRPDVPNAETLSKSRFKNGMFLFDSEKISSNEIKKTNAVAMAPMVIACWIWTSDSSLPNAEVCLFLLMVESRATSATASAFTFMPPDTEPADPPTNISPVKKKLVCCFVSAKLIVEKPAVRPLIDSNIETHILFKIGNPSRVALLLYSENKNTKAPVRIRMEVITRTSFVLIVNKTNLLFFTRSSVTE